MNDSDLRTAIYNEAVGNTALSDLITGGIFYEGEAEDASFPYVSFFIVSDVPLHHFAGTIEGKMIQFSIWGGLDTGIAKVDAIAKALTATFDRVALSYSSNVSVGMLRQSGTGPTRFEDCWQKTVDYTCWYQ